MISKTKLEDNIFWENQIKINPSKLIDFLSSNGFAKLLISENDYILVRCRRGIMYEIKDFRVNNYIQSFLKFNKLPQVYEVFVKGVSSFITKSG